MSPIVRFAPSPTGYLHIGGARTALFNWLFAHHFKGKMLLRIEDTDRERSTPEAVEAIFKGLKWLGITWEENPVFQHQRLERHKEVAYALLEKGLAYRCYCTPEELELMREEARQNNLPPRYDGRWRDRPHHEAPENIPFVVRFKSPQIGQTTIHDLVQGEVTVAHQQLDDLVLLRADGTPTFNLSVVVDDHDMGITHVIRGDDHLTNMFRQFHIFAAMGWTPPQYAHIPLIHGPDGAKLSKRHGALGVEAYEAMGFLPEAMCNYLLRLGWSHGDAEIISIQEAIEWFGLDHVGKSPSRFDFVKLTNLNGHYIREAENDRLVKLIEPFLGNAINELIRNRLLLGMNGLKQRAKTLLELAENAGFYIKPSPLDIAGEKSLREEKELLSLIKKALVDQSIWTEEELEACLRRLAETQDIKLGKLAQPLRLCLTGKTVSPSVFEIMAVLGKEETLNRINWGETC